MKKKSRNKMVYKCTINCTSYIRRFDVSYEFLLSVKLRNGEKTLKFFDEFSLSPIKSSVLRNKSKTKQKAGKITNNYRIEGNQRQVQANPNESK
jgi:hypothetical protein